MEARVTQSELKAVLAVVKERYGKWTYDIPLGEGVWTRGQAATTNTRLRRVLQVAADQAGKPLADCRVLDLGCLEGLCSLEFARQGARVVGVEIREANLIKARLAQEALGL